MIRNPKALTVSCFVSSFFIGVGTTVVGAAARNIGLTPYEIGLMFAIQNVGFIIAVSTAGALSDTFEKPRILLFASIALGTAFAIFYLWPSFLLNLTVMFFIGIGMGGYEGITDAMLLDMHDERESFYISINHFFITFGSLMITLYLLFLQMNWRRSMVQSGITIFCLALFFLLSRLKTDERVEKKLFGRLKALKDDKLVFSLLAATSCIVGCELATHAVLTTFLMDLRGFSQVTSKLGLIIFLAGIATGRLCVGLITKRHQLYRYLLVLLFLCVIFFSLLYLMDTNSILLTTVLIYLCGLTISATFPIILSITGIIYKEMAGTALGIIKMGIPIGGIVIPLFVSLASRFFSFRISLALFPFFSLVSFLIMLANRDRFKSHEMLRQTVLTAGTNG